MRISFFIDDDYKLSSETVDIELKGDVFDIPEKPEKLKAFCLVLARLRGHYYYCDVKNIKIK